MKSAEKRLPESGALIIDEAHHFERAASEHLGIRVTYIGLHAKLSQLGHIKPARTFKENAPLVPNPSLAGRFLF